MSNSVARIALTIGEPAGIGPDLVVQAAQRDWPCEVVAIGGAKVLAERAAALNLPIELKPYSPTRAPTPARPGQLLIEDLPPASPVRCGQLDPTNAPSVLSTLDRACDGCLHAEFDAMVTAPVHKANLNFAERVFVGHTEYLADRCGASQPVMLLVAGDLRVALVTTHLPLRAVPDAVTPELIALTARQLDAGLKTAFGLARPRIIVLGLNPHAGEDGHLGAEEHEVIEPVLAQLRAEGLDVTGPVPADTAFTPAQLDATDAVLAMYHDQGLTVLKHRGFGGAVNITLGLPIVRTSVDHGTALELAGTGRADGGSLTEAINIAHSLCLRRHV